MSKDTKDWMEKILKKACVIQKHFVYLNIRLRDRLININP